MVDDTVLDEHFARREVALEVGRIILGIPEAELDGPEHGQACRLCPEVRDPGPPHLERLAGRHDVERLGTDAAALGSDDRVPESMAAAVALEFALRRLPARVPIVARGVVADVQESATDVQRSAVVAIADQSAQPGVPVERVATGGVRDEGEVVLVAQVVDPWQRRVGTADDVFALVVVELAEAHPISSVRGSWDPVHSIDGRRPNPTFRRP